MFVEKTIIRKSVLKGMLRGMRKSVLVVDNNKSVRDDVRSVLSAAGHGVVTVESTSAAIAARRVHIFDAVLVGTGISVAKGIAAAQALHALETQETRVPIFAIVENHRLENARHIAMSGVDGVMAKTFAISDFNELMAGYRVIDTLRSSVFSRMHDAVGLAEAKRHYGMVLSHAEDITEETDATSFSALSRIAVRIGLVALARAARACAEVTSPAALGKALAWLRNEANLARGGLARVIHGLRNGSLSFGAMTGATSPFGSPAMLAVGALSQRSPSARSVAVPYPERAVRSA